MASDLKVLLLVQILYPVIADCSCILYVWSQQTLLLRDLNFINSDQSSDFKSHYLGFVTCITNQCV